MEVHRLCITMIQQPDIRERLGAYWVSRYVMRVLEALQQRWQPVYGEVSYLVLD